MPNRPVPMREADLTRYAKAMAKAGVTAWRIDIDPATGRHSIFAGQGATSPVFGPDPDELLK